MRPYGWQVCSELLKRFVVRTLAPPPTIMPQTTEVLSQTSKGIRLGALGWLARSHSKAIQLYLLYRNRVGGLRGW